MRATTTAIAALAFTLGCQSAGMEPLAQQPLQAPAPSPDSPYEIELVDAAGRTLPTYAAGGRYYVLGHVGARYGIRVRNPTPERVEAVISVDGLDVIDGETASAGKRGYVVAPHSDIVVGGFRVSSSHVAAFRFSSVARSYAGRKGKARNVGVIGVAIFTERAAAPLTLPEQHVAGGTRDEASGSNDYDYEPRGAGSDRAARTRIAPRRRPAPTPPAGGGEAADAAPGSEPCCGPRPELENRPGLGTEFGERRYSSVQFTRFVRADPSTPTAYAELRYNDAAGLAALGIDVGQPYDADELSRRETAEPFPGERFAQPPR